MASSSSAESLARLGQLARQSLRDQTALLKRSADLTRQALKGDLNWAEAGKAYVETASREGVRYLQGIGELGIEYLGGMIKLGNEVTASLLDSTTRAGRQSHGSAGPRAPATPEPAPAGQTWAAATDSPPDPPASRDPGRRIALTLRGPLGGRAEGSVTVANKHNRARSILLKAGDLRGSDGKVVAAKLDLDPPGMTIGPGEERLATVGVDLSAAYCAAGDRYTGLVEVSGGDEATLDVTVEVTA